jgi:hypothetical protein
MPPRSRSDHRLVSILWYASLVGEVVAWIAFGLMIVIVTLALNPSLARGGVACQTSPDHRSSHWTWREIDGRRCWYQGSRSLPKSALTWAGHRYRIERPIRSDPAPPPVAATPPPAPAVDPQGLDMVLPFILAGRDLAPFFARWLGVEQALSPRAVWFTP